MSQHWTLKDKNGNPPLPEDYEKCMNLLRKIDKEHLFPCPRSADELEMEKKDSDTVPREMNIFMVFLRQLAHVFKELELPDDGKNLSRIAPYIWNGSSEDEKRSYALIAEELKRRHLERYPNYTYERRKRKAPEEGFIHVNGIGSYNNYPEESCDNYQVVDENIPLIANNIMSQNFTNVSLQQLQQFQQLLQMQQQQLPYQQLQQQPQLPQLSPSYYSSYFTDGGNPGIGEPSDDLFVLERPIDELFYGNLNS